MAYEIFYLQIKDSVKIYLFISAIVGSFRVSYSKDLFSYSFHFL